jgi:hypothetical protein
MEKERKLYEHVKNFIESLEITCGEDVHQRDSVIESAYEFIDGCCEIVGYCQYDEVTYEVLGIDGKQLTDSDIKEASNG